MRPLARRIFLTQGLIVLLVFGVSLFAYVKLLEAKSRASRLRAEYELGIAHEMLLSELRDIGRSRPFYFLEKRSRGTRTEEFKRSFYSSLERVAGGVEELARQAGGRQGLDDLVDQLRLNLAQYRRAVAEQELYSALEDPVRLSLAEDRPMESRERMSELTRASKRERETIVASEIEALGQAAHDATVLARLFCGLAVLVASAATFWLTRSIHRPVRDLRAATEALSRGEFDRRIDVRNRDELGDLARAFNEMAARLQELDELKSGFVSMVSHDLKTPLTSMKEAVELLAEGVGGDLTPRQRRLLTITRDGMERLGIYVQGILDVFRFEAGRVHLVREPLSLSDVVADQIELVEGRCREAGVVLSRELDRDLPLVEADRFRLGQVVANLLDNAIKFTPRDGTILLRTGVEAWKDDLAVLLEVSDTGIGIAPRDLKHVFDKFFQGSRRPGRPVHGAGLGLAIVKSLVEAHGGQVSVDSTLGRGTIFRVLLPAAARMPAGRALAG